MTGPEDKQSPSPNWVGPTPDPGRADIGRAQRREHKCQEQVPGYSNASLAFWWLPLGNPVCFAPKDPGRNNHTQGSIEAFKTMYLSSREINYLLI